VEEVLVKVLLGVLREDAGNTRVVKLRTPGSAQHLQHIRQIHVLVALHLGVVELCALDDDQVGRQIDTPGQRAGGHQDLNLVVQEELLSQLPVRLDQTGMMKSDAKVDGFLERIVLDPSQIELQVIFVHPQEPSRVVFHAAKVDQIFGSESGLPS